MSGAARFILCADDFAMSAGISDGILALAEAGRLSATSAMVNMPRWAEDAPKALALRDRIALGLHLNLTFGAPLGPMPQLAPNGELPPVNKLIDRGTSRMLGMAELEGEIARQIDRFETVAGVPPDFIDGHHHVHVLPGVRTAVLAVLARRFPQGGPLLRDPSDRVSAIVNRAASTKALAVAALAFGFRHAAETAGFATNRGFSGFSVFGPVPYADEFETFLRQPGPRPMIMCHPGLADLSLGDRDEIAARRPGEHAYLAARPGLPDILWRVSQRDAAGFPWREAG